MEAVVQLAGYEHLAPVQSRSTYALADLLLVLVHLGGVDVAVSHIEGYADCSGRIGQLDLEHAEAELWDGLSVVKGDRRYCAHPVLIVVTLLGLADHDAAWP